MVKFVKWITTAERAAQWGIEYRLRGGAAGRLDDPDHDEVCSSSFPAAAVARDQLRYAVAELSTHDNQSVIKALDDGLEAALMGAKTGSPGDEGRAGRGRAHPPTLPAVRCAYAAVLYLAFLLLAPAAVHAQPPIEDELVIQTPMSAFVVDSMLKEFAQYAKEKWGDHAEDARPAGRNAGVLRGRS